MSNWLIYVASEHQNSLIVDLKCVYKATASSAAEAALDALATKSGKLFPVVIRSWHSKWNTLSTYFRYSDYARNTIYLTNAVEAVHRQFGKLTKDQRQI